MELERETRSRYYIKIDKPTKVNIDGVKADGDTVEFFKTHYKTFDDCKKWLDQYSKSGGFIPMSRVAKGLDNVHTKAVKITSDIWDKMTKYMVSPDEYSPADFVVFQNQLANTAPDRDGQRFSVDYLKSFKKSIVGKSKLNGHDHTATGEGRFFDAEVEKLSVDDFIETLDFVPDKQFIKKLGKIEKNEGGIHWLLTKYYMPVTNEKEINDIKTGIKGHFMSIGFAPPQGPIAVKDDGGKDEILWYEWQNTKDFEVEAIEGSDVYLGAQYGAGNRKSYKDGADIPAISVDDEDSAQSDEPLNPQTDESGKTLNIKKETKMNVKIKSLAIDLEIENQEAAEKAFADVDEKIIAMQNDLKAAEENLAAEKKNVEQANEKIAELGKSIESASVVAENYKTLREDIENWILKVRVGLGQLKFVELEAERKKLAEKTIAELFEIRKSVTDDLAKKPGFNAAQLSIDYEEPKTDKKELRFTAPFTLD